MIYDTVAVAEIPVPGVDIGNDTTIADTSFLVLNAGGGYKQYAWNDGVKDSVNVIKGFELPEGINRIWVNVYNKNGCEGYDEMLLTVIKTGKDKISELLNNSCYIFPNPTQDVTTVYFTARLDNLELNICNPLGKTVASKSLSVYEQGTPIVFELGSFTPGLYTLAIRANGGHAAKKIVLQ